MARVSCSSLPGRPPVLLLLYTTTYACVCVLCFYVLFFLCFVTARCTLRAIYINIYIYLRYVGVVLLLFDWSTVLSGRR